MADECEHLEGLTAADFPAPNTPGECEDCTRDGTRWVHLRECRDCGHVGCCDSSPQTHATKHHQATQHPVIRSVEPGDSWAWCYVHEAMADLGAPAV